MGGWDPRRPDAWAELFSLVAVPVFGAQPRASPHPKGVHSLMLDGARGSFVLSTEGPQHLLAGPDPIRWAWSANVIHAVAIAGDTAIVRRWDSPIVVKEWPVLSEREARALFRSLQRSHEPPSVQSVIARGLRTFRAVRIAIEKQGGSALDVVFAFNTILAWVAQLPDTDSNIEIEFADAIHSVQRTGQVSFTPRQVSTNLLRYPIGDLARLLREGEGASGSARYLLDANLLIRHASGPLYQEAHKQLLVPARQQSQGEFWSRDMLLVGSEGPRTRAPKFVHHTPPSLARVLVEIALHFVDADRSLDILDPACGSGVFLIEAVREAGIQKDIPQTVKLRGFDQSDLAVAMADFCVRNANPDNGDHTVAIQSQDSLATNDWGIPNIIAMNPPFVAWEDLSQSERKIVTSVLGPLHSGRPDLAFAFVVRALQSLKLGGVMAALVPSSFLDGQSARKIRAYIEQSNEFQVRLIGHFHDFKYFDASVEPSFIVVSRSTRETPIQIVTAKTGFIDNAIGALRRGKTTRRAGYEVFTIPENELPPDRWTPQTQRNLRFVEAVTTNTTQTVADFFAPRLGIRTGNKSVFIVSESEIDRICPTSKERRFFRPVADKIEAGRIQPSGYVFYPYKTDGTLLLNTEQELEDAVPHFYDKRLRPAKEALKNRSLYRKWWEVTRPVSTWLAAHTPRIISQAFGRAGNFAFDSEGEYAVVQGVGWCWKHGNPSEETMLAYLGLLNSSIFDDVLSYFCPQLHGGQYQLYRQFVERVPLPSLTNGDVRALSRIGRAIVAGRQYDVNAQKDSVLHAYGVSPDGRPLDDERHRQTRIGREFRRLASEWEADTAVYSFVSQKVSHPHYRKIIDLGTDVIPHLLRDMRDSPGYWSDALVELTGTDPVPEDAESLNDVAAAWVRWGRTAGYDT